MNMQNSSTNVKPAIPATVGPWQSQRQAAVAAREDILCKAHGYFHVVKSHGAYGYVTGTNPPLFQSDRVVATYYYIAGRVWSHARIVTNAQSKEMTR